MYLAQGYKTATLRCCHILTDKGNGRRTDRKNAKKCLSGGEKRLGGDEGPGGGCKERIKRIINAYVRTSNGQRTFN